MLYLVFALGFSLSFGEWWPVGMMVVLTVNRGLSMVLDPQPSAATKDRLQRSWATATMVYLTAAFATTLLPVPELGMTQDFARGLDLPGRGLWISEPHRVVALGSIYFTAMALLEARTRVRASHGSATGIER